MEHLDGHTTVKNAKVFCEYFLDEESHSLRTMFYRVLKGGVSKGRG